MTNNHNLPVLPAPVIEGNFNAPPPLDSPSRPRRFYYDGQEFEDPGPEYSIREVLNFLAGTYPELPTGAWTKNSWPDGYDQITFYKVTGEKGHISPDELLAALDSLPVEPLEALRLTEELLELERQGELTTEALTKMSDGIQAAHQQLRTMEKMAALCLDRVLRLPAMPHPRVPLGF